MNFRQQLAAAQGFDWDEGNLEKNLEKHSVAFWEAEETFFNQPLVVRFDEVRSSSEPRYFALGRTDAGRHLFVAFTLR
ncbi:MAG TPA: BrnT family toxin, partial [Thermoanaerobaculia bacterium]|nr:BrnT family toxin [Thermoanaerobaculia bacterium]